MRLVGTLSSRPNQGFWPLSNSFFTRFSFVFDKKDKLKVTCSIKVFYSERVL